MEGGKRGRVGVERRGTRGNDRSATAAGGPTQTRFRPAPTLPQQLQQQLGSKDGTAQDRGHAAWTRRTLAGTKGGRGVQRKGAGPVSEVH